MKTNIYLLLTAAVTLAVPPPSKDVGTPINDDSEVTRQTKAKTDYIVNLNIKDDDDTVNPVGMQLIKTEDWNPDLRNTSNAFTAAISFPYSPIPKLLYGPLNVTSQLWMEGLNIHTHEKFVSSEIRYAWLNEEYGGPVEFYRFDEMPTKPPTRNFASTIENGIIFNKLDGNQTVGEFFLCDELNIHKMLAYYPRNEGKPTSCKPVQLDIGKMTPQQK